MHLVQAVFVEVVPGAVLEGDARAAEDKDEGEDDHGRYDVEGEEDREGTREQCGGVDDRERHQQETHPNQEK